MAKVEIDEDYFSKLVICKNSLKEICSLFGLTEEKLNHPNCGIWVKDQIKQLLTTNNLYKATIKEQSNNGSLNDYHNIETSLASLDDLGIN